MRFRHQAATAVLLACLAMLACRPALQLRIETRVFHDGSIERSLTVVGRTSDGEIPTGEEWFASRAGLRLAEPDRWSRVDRTPGRIRAEGFYAVGETPPATIALGKGDSWRTARGSTSLEVEERQLVRRWDYVERHGDPYSAIDRATALRELIDRAAEIVKAELRREFGDAVELAPVDRFLHDDLHAVIASLLAVNRIAPGDWRRDERRELWRAALRARGIPTVDGDDDFWDAQAPLVVGWARSGIARRLAEAGAIAEDERLLFLPGADDWEERATELVEYHIGDQDRLEEEFGHHARALSGYFSDYGDPGMPRFRFESTVTLPGSILFSNGSCAGASCRWLFREDDLAAGEMILRVSSVEPIDAALRRLGARRSLDAAQLLQLVDLLWKRDPQGALLDALTEAVRRGKLDRLLEEGVVPEELDHAALELYELLEP